MAFRTGGSMGHQCAYIDYQGVTLHGFAPEQIWYCHWFNHAHVPTGYARFLKSYASEGTVIVNTDVAVIKCTAGTEGSGAHKLGPLTRNIIHTVNIDCPL